jgi:hypothetical protein
MVYVARQPHHLHDSAVAFIFPDQQVRDFSRIVEIVSHNPRRDDGHLLAVFPRPEAKEMAVPSAPLFSPLHRLIPVTVLSGKIPIRGRVFKESVKVCTPKSPPVSDDSARDFATLYIFPYCSCA